MEAGASTSGALAASSACRSFQVQSAQVQGTEAQCGQDHNAPIIHASILVQYFQRPIVIKVGFYPTNPVCSAFVRAFHSASRPHAAMMLRNAACGFSTGVQSLLASLAGIKVPHEVIVNDDSRSEHDQWLSRLGGRGFLFHSPNVHEIRGYNRLARFARGDLIIMMQDDDQPKNGQWVKNALGLFNAHNR